MRIPDRYKLPLPAVKTAAGQPGRPAQSDTQQRGGGPERGQIPRHDVEAAQGDKEQGREEHRQQRQGEAPPCFSRAAQKQLPAEQGERMEAQQEQLVRRWDVQGQRRKGAEKDQEIGSAR